MLEFTEIVVAQWAQAPVSDGLVPTRRNHLVMQAEFEIRTKT